MVRIKKGEHQGMPKLCKRPKSNSIQPSGVQKKKMKKKRKSRSTFEATTEGTSLADCTPVPEQLLKRKILPKEHWQSTYIDGRVYVATLEEFSNEANKRGSMLDEVAFLPVDDLAGLLCGSRIFLMIRNSQAGADILDLCRIFKENHARLNLKAIANEYLVRKHSARLLLMEDCPEQYLSASGISFYFELLLRFLVRSTYWSRLQIRKLSIRLADRLMKLEPSMAVIDESFYRAKLCSLRINASDVQRVTGLPVEEVLELFECLLANAMRFFVLYCVHALRDQVDLNVSRAGNAFYRLKTMGNAHEPNDREVSAKGPKFCSCVSDETMSKPMPLNDVQYELSANSFQGSIDCASLVYQIAHLPVTQITRFILGEHLFARLQADYPKFVTQMHEYSFLFKVSQSRMRYRQYMFVRKRRDNHFLRFATIKFYAKIALFAAFDWITSAKREGLLRAFSTYVRLWEKKERLSEDILQSCGSFEEYHLLKRFSRRHNSVYEVPDLLLNKVSRRLDGFFLVFLIHGLREHTIATKDSRGLLKLQFRKDYVTDALRSDIPAPHEEWTFKSQKSQSSDFDQPSGSTTAADLNLAVARRNENSSVGHSPEDFHQVVEPEKTFSTGDLGAECCTDEKWEIKLLQQVKQDPSVPLYFKTTFGILTANNRNLREEKAFLQSQLTT